MKTFGEHEKLFADCQRRVMHIVGKCLDNIDEAANSIKPEAVSNYMHTLQCVRGGREGRRERKRRREEGEGEEGKGGRGRGGGGGGGEGGGRRGLQVMYRIPLYL